VAGILILPEWLIVSAKEPPRQGWGVRILGEIISDTGPNEDLAIKYPDDQVLRADGQVLSPGFVNTHTHLYGVLAHGMPLTKAPAGFEPFLKEFWWPMVEDRVDHDMLRAAVDWQCQTMLQSGVTSFYDCLEAPNTLPGCLTVEGEVVARHGLRALLSFEATQRVSEVNGLLGLQENINFTTACKQKGGLIQGLICYHTTFTCSPEFILKNFETARQLGCLVHMHCSESRYEVQYCLDHYGLRPVQFYNQLGVLGANMVASQCVQLDDTEVALLAGHQVQVAHMPLSNCEVGGGIAPIPKMAAANMTLGLGSDSYIDNFFEIMRGAFLIHKAVQQDPRLMPANLVYFMATEGGARALHLPNVGRLAPGWCADLQLIDANFPTPAAEWNLYDQLVLYSNPEQVLLVMVNGRILLREGVTLPETVDRRRALWKQSRRLWQTAL
jgi:cytosine/adenosine deaminase-related metal-dependent hydrolase